MSFLPENYEEPRTSDSYMKPREGENRIRILSQPIIGWEEWMDKKPHRYAFDKKPAKPFDADKPVKLFWAFIVFNYNDEKIQIYEIRQATIRRAIQALCKDKDWGEPYHYDIKITKTGEGVETEYTVNPIPHKALDPYIVNQFNEHRCNLNALFTGDDPFAPDQNYTPLGISVGEKIHALTQNPVKEVDDIKEAFKQCSKDYQQSLLNTLGAMKPPRTLDDLPIEIFDRVRQAIYKNRKETQTSQLPF